MGKDDIGSNEMTTTTSEKNPGHKGEDIFLEEPRLQAARIVTGTMAPSHQGGQEERIEECPHDAQSIE